MKIITISEEDFRTLLREELSPLLFKANKKDDPINKEVLNIDEAAQYLKIPKATIYQLTSRREIPHKKLGKRLVFTKMDLDIFLQSKNQSTSKSLNFYGN